MTPGGRRVWLREGRGRLLLALLTLLASFAYLTREPEGGPGMAGMTRPAAPMSDMAGMADMVMPGPHAPPTHDHRAHCPFCFTVAFALEAPDLSVPRVAGSWSGLPLPVLPALPRLAQVHADARAPPD